MPKAMPPEDYATLPRSRKEAQRLGTRFYFTGNRCSRGHVAPLYTSTSNCTMCQVEHTRKHGGHSARPSRAEYYQMAVAKLESLGARMISPPEAYEVAGSLLETKCRHGETVNTTWDSLKQGRYSWHQCSACNSEGQVAAKGHAWGYLRQFAEYERGGEYLEPPDRVVDTHTRVWWKCCNGHRPFEMTVTNVVHSGISREIPVRWCSLCKGSFVEVLGHKFRSQFEANCALILVGAVGLGAIRFQEKYHAKKRPTCDFILPAHDLWIEVSLYKDRRYMLRIKAKRSLVKNFIFIDSYASLEAEVDAIKRGTIRDSIRRSDKRIAAIIASKS